MNDRIQRMRLIVNGAVGLYEGEGLEIAQLLKDGKREDLLRVLDAMVTALYWLQDILADEPGEGA